MNNGWRNPDNYIPSPTLENEEYLNSIGKPVANKKWLLRYHYQSLFTNQFSIEDEKFQNLWTAIETYLYYYGKCALIKFPLTNDYHVAVIGTITYNSIGEVLSATATFNSTDKGELIKYSYKIVSGDKNSVIIRNNFGITANLQPLGTYQLLQNEIDNIDGYNTLAIQNAKLTFLQAIILDNFGDGSTFSQEMQNLFNQVNNWDNISSIAIYKQSVKGDRNQPHQAITSFGENSIMNLKYENNVEAFQLARDKQISYVNRLAFIDDEFNIKKERKIAEEINKNDFVVKIGRYAMKNLRQKAIEEINQKFSLNWKLVDKLEEIEEIKEEKNDKINDKGVDANANINNK